MNINDALGMREETKTKWQYRTTCGDVVWRTCDGESVQANLKYKDHNWITSTAYSHWHECIDNPATYECDENGKRIEPEVESVNDEVGTTGPNGLPILDVDQYIADKHADLPLELVAEAVEADEPLKVGDLVELAPGYSRHSTNPPWVKRVTKIDGVGDAWIGDWCFNQYELRRVDHPSCQSCGVAWSDHAGPQNQCEQLRQATGRIEHLKQQAANYENAADHLAIDLNAANERIAELEKTWGEVREEYESRITKLESENYRYGESYQELEDCYARLNRKCRTAKLALNEARETIAELERAINEWRKLDELNNAIKTELQQKLSAVTAERDEAIATIHGLIAERNQLSDKLREREAEAAAMRETVDKTHKAISAWLSAGNIGDDWTTVQHDQHVALKGTAGRELLAEMEQLRKRSDEWETWYLDMVDRFKRKVRTAKAELNRLREVVPAKCLGCGEQLIASNAWMTDGCPCNSSHEDCSLEQLRAKAKTLDELRELIAHPAVWIGVFLDNVTINSLTAFDIRDKLIAIRDSKAVRDASR